MTKRKWIISILVFLLICFGAGGFYYYKTYGPKPYNEELKDNGGWYIGYSLKYTNIGNSAVIFEGDHYALSNKYIMGARVGYQKEPSQLDDPNEIYHDDYFYVDLYKTDSTKKKLVKSLNILSIIQNYNKNYLPYIPFTPYKDKETGKWVFEVSIFDFSEDRYSDNWIRFLVIDIDSGKVISTDSHDLEVISVGFSPVYTQKVTNVYDKLKERGFSYYKDGDEDDQTDYISVLYFTADIDYSELRLAKEYPESLKFMKEGNSFNNLSPVQDKEIARLLSTEDETDLFQGVTLYGEYSKDGQDHVVQSYDDLMNWYQAKEE
ncbi:hypothetical protein [Streptococcus loxodontisalivarius]|uniref:Lipoprotein n=1 Tax=Streptococcus loxodontisalivarius TaxID=1349415 RepID=A0ABS2PRG5_9STRE|nr:hypothetical protein [Streptococcus loxodontisalivarius]MBM7642628.1 hypothetical protein [Streptococcus loxodontisalivarius]